MIINNCTIVITGASSGLGGEMARLLAAKGACIVMLARNEQNLAEIRRQIAIEGGHAYYYVLDITRPQEVRCVFKQIINRFNGIDILINCAGIGKFQSLSEMNDEIIDRMIDVNVRGMIHCSKAVLASMVPKKRGCIVNIASLAGIVTTPKSVVYGATKHAVIGFSDGLRLELEQDGIRVIVVNPGPIRTPFLSFADPSGSYVAHAGRYMLKPRAVAEKIVHAIEKNKRELRIPWYMGIGARLYQMLPVLFEKVFKSFLKLK
ncbi:SDR family oxidoreductase [Sporolactobacillus sp. CPB3-1]|uniref:SDR family oxidoreductase n=1 Tax=Sporolactobacillus mangiferae TaxID=2940498 RepID=A0ABT0MAI9_9BACL|nr:SDR family oxidoreductase [Sporolactobacillus mangiferae]MCL1631891.1 SDR family oxidoreductase [Sporolactobacillus mangiferae]